MAIVKPKLDFTNPINQDLNYLKILIGYADSVHVDLITANIGSLRFNAVDNNCILLGSSISTKSSSHLADVYIAMGSGTTQDFTQELIDKEADDFPENVNGSGGGCQYIYSQYDNIITDTEGTFWTLKGLKLSEISGIDPDEWLSAIFGNTFYAQAVGVVRPDITAITGSATVSQINDLNQSFAEYRIQFNSANGNPDNIEDQYPMPASFLGGHLGSKTTAELMNEYLKLHQKAQLNHVDLMKRNAINFQKPQITVKILGSLSVQNFTSYESSQSGNNVDDWGTITEESTLNGDTVSTDENWDRLTYAEPTENNGMPFSSSIDTLLIQNKVTTGATWTGTRTKDYSSFRNFSDEIYMQLPVDINNILLLSGAIDSDEDSVIFAEFHIQAVLEIDCGKDSYQKYELNQAEDGVDTVEQRVVETVGWKGQEERIKAVTLYNEKLKIDIMKLRQNIINHYDIINTTGNIDTILDDLGVFNPDTNPFGYFTATGCASKAKQIFDSLEPPIKDDTADEPDIVSFTIGGQDHEDGRDFFDYSANKQSFTGELKIHTCVNFSQVVDGSEVPMLNNFLSKVEKSFDYS